MTRKTFLISLVVLLGLVLAPVLYAVVTLGGNVYIAGNQICLEGTTDDANEVCLVFTDPGGDFNWTFSAVTDTVAGLAAAQTLTNKIIDGNSNTLSILAHATDCTAIITGVANQICLELDSERLFSCQPTAGGCDTPAEWILTGAADGVGVDQIADEGSNLTKRATVNFIGAGVSCVDNGGSVRTDCTIAGGGSSGPSARSTWQDDFPCITNEDGEWGTLGWQIVASPASGGECNYQTRIDPGWTKMIPAAGNTEAGIVLGRSTATTAQTFGQSAISSIEADTSFVAYFAFNTQDLTEVQVQVGLANDQASEVLDYADATRDFIGAYFKNETVDTASECFGVAGSLANWQALVQDSGTSSGLQNTTEVASSSITSMTWVRIDVPAVNQVRVCVDVATALGGPAFVNCYTETTATRIPDTGLAPAFVAMTCDGTSGGNDGRVDIAYFYADTRRW